MKIRCKVVCNKTDCLFRRQASDGSDGAICLHPEKAHYLKQIPCPLYRMNWQLKISEASQIEDLLGSIRKKH